MADRDAVGRNKLAGSSGACPIRRRCQPEAACAVAGLRRARRRPAFTLLEVILALSLTTVTVGLMCMAIQVNLDVADKSHEQVAGGGYGAGPVSADY